VKEEGEDRGSPGSEKRRPGEEGGFANLAH